MAKGNTVSFDGILCHDSREQIDKCLNCMKPKCNNCFYNDKAAEYNRLRYNRKQNTKRDFNIAEISRQTGIVYSTLHRRVTKGGLEYAISGISSLKKWREMNEAKTQNS